MEFVLIPKYHYANTIKNKIGGEYGTQERRQKSVRVIGGKTRMKETTWKT
jgi:hypothetical protein